MPSTLAKEFIDRKLQEYVEPVRKGKAKGETVGLSSRKFTAALVMAIYDLGTAEVEEIVGVRRGLISKWHTESNFLRQMEELRSEFALELLSALTRNVSKALYSDAQHYSADLKKIITAICDEAAGRGDGGTLLKIWRLLRLTIVTPYIGHSSTTNRT